MIREISRFPTVRGADSASGSPYAGGLRTLIPATVPLGYCRVDVYAGTQQYPSEWWLEVWIEYWPVDPVSGNYCLSEDLLYSTIGSTTLRRVDNTVVAGDQTVQIRYPEDLLLGRIPPPPEIPRNFVSGFPYRIYYQGRWSGLSTDHEPTSLELDITVRTDLVEAEIQNCVVYQTVSGPAEAQYLCWYNRNRLAVDYTVSLGTDEGTFSFSQVPEFSYPVGSDLNGYQHEFSYIRPQESYLDTNLWQYFDAYYTEGGWQDGDASKNIFSIGHSKVHTVVDFTTSVFSGINVNRAYNNRWVGGALAVRSNNAGAGSKVEVRASSTEGVLDELGFTGGSFRDGDGSSPAELCSGLIRQIYVMPSGNLDLQFDSAYDETVMFTVGTYGPLELANIISAALTNGACSPSPWFYMDGDTNRLAIRVARETPEEGPLASYIYRHNIPFISAHRRSWDMYRFYQLECYAVPLSPAVADTPSFRCVTPGPILDGNPVLVTVPLQAAEHFVTLDTGISPPGRCNMFRTESWQGGFTYHFQGIHLTRYAPEDSGTEIEKRDGGYARLSIVFQPIEALQSYPDSYARTVKHPAMQVVFEVDGKQTLVQRFSGRNGDFPDLVDRLGNYWGLTLQDLTPFEPDVTDPALYGNFGGFLDPIYRQDISSPPYTVKATPRFWVFGSSSINEETFDVSNCTENQYSVLVYDAATLQGVGSGQDVDLWESLRYRYGFQYDITPAPYPVLVYRAGLSGIVGVPVGLPDNTGDIISVPQDMTYSDEIMTVDTISPNDGTTEYFDWSVRATDSTNLTAGYPGDPGPLVVGHRSLDAETNGQTDQWSSTRFIVPGRRGGVGLPVLAPGWIVRVGTGLKTDIYRGRAWENVQREFLEILMYGETSEVAIAGYVAAVETPERTVHVVHAPNDTGKSMYENLYTQTGGFQGSVLVRSDAISPSTILDESGEQIIVYEKESAHEIRLIRRHRNQDWESTTDVQLFSGNEPGVYPVLGGLIVAYHDGTNIAVRWGNGRNGVYQWSGASVVASAPVQRPFVCRGDGGQVLVFYADSSWDWTGRYTLDQGVNWNPLPLPDLPGQYIASAVYWRLNLFGLLTVNPATSKLYWTDLVWTGTGLRPGSASRTVDTSAPRQYAAGVQWRDGTLQAIYYDGSGHLKTHDSRDWGQSHV